MIRYSLKRLLIFIPTLILISMLAFALSKWAPGDPVELIMRAGSGAVERGNLADAERVYRETAAFLGLDKPPFYFAISSQAYPDTLYRITNKDERNTLRRLIARYGNWPRVAAYQQRRQELEESLSRLPDRLAPEAVNAIYRQLQNLRFSNRAAVIESRLSDIAGMADGSLPLRRRIGEPVRALRESFDEMVTHPTRHLLYIPDLKWYGFDNQYHHWFSDLLRGDFGTSYIDGRPVADKLWDALKWTLLLNGLALLIAYVMAIPLGVYSAVHRGSRFDRLTTLGLFMLYSLPTFWIATLLVVFLTTPEYGMDWFPTMGTGSLPESAPFWRRFWDTAYHLVLPVFCLTYGSLAFLTRQMRGSMVDVLKQDYIRTARAQGLPESQVIWQHAFRNALFPIITLFASVFPAMLAGSVVVEVIFNIPGMGLLTVDSIFQSNWPVVYAILIIGAVLTMLGILVADILYAWTDPRVRFDNRN